MTLSRTSLLPLLLLPMMLSGQQPVAPKNLKLLDPKTDLRFVMGNFAQALGVSCSYCHEAGDFASDANPKKDVTRKMIAMVRQIDASFPSNAGVFPAGYHEVDCNTCHQGNVKPVVKAPRQFFNRNEWLGTPAPAVTPGVNLKVLPADTRVHGDGSVMHDFRDALNVDCNYCHGGGKPFEADENPRKDIARKMIVLVRQINANFPGTGVYPLGTQLVSCYTCHGGSTHPDALDNIRYDAPSEKK